MQFLLDTSAQNIASGDFVAGQLLTPLSRFSDWGGVYAIDNGAYAGFRRESFASLLARQAEHKARCLFVAVPDIVGDARRTLELWRYRHDFAAGWPLALVAQDGAESMDMPWDELDALFVGGRDPWKDSTGALDLVRAAKVLGKHVHVGRVNAASRFERFADVGADTCDGSGVSRFDHMLENIIAASLREPPPVLFDAQGAALSA